MRLSPEATQAAEAIGEALVVLGVSWGVARTAPTLLRPMLVAGAGLGLVYAARRYGDVPTYRLARAPSAAFEYDDGQGDVIEGEAVEVSAATQ